MGPRTYVSYSNDPDAREPVLVSPCCDARMSETDGTCPECKELCGAVEGENDGDERDEPEWGDVQ